MLFRKVGARAFKGPLSRPVWLLTMNLTTASILSGKGQQAFPRSAFSPSEQCQANRCNFAEALATFTFLGLGRTSLLHCWNLDLLTSDAHHWISHLHPRRRSTHAARQIHKYCLVSGFRSQSALYIQNRSQCTIGMPAQR